MDFRRALFEDTRDRANQELANVPVVAGENGEYSLIFKSFTEEEAKAFGFNDKAAANASFLSQKWGANGANYVDGYVTIYGYNEGDKGESVEKQLVA